METPATLEAAMPSGAAVIELLRRFLAMFRPSPRNSPITVRSGFDYFRLGEAGTAAG